MNYLELLATAAIIVSSIAATLSGGQELKNATERLLNSNEDELTQELKQFDFEDWEQWIEEQNQKGE